MRQSVARNWRTIARGAETCWITGCKSSFSARRNFQRIEIPREAFLSGLSKSGPRVNAAELNQRLKTSFENSDISLSDMKFEPIGRDGNAVYFSMRMSMTVGEINRPVSGISGITLLNSLPLSINVYEGTGSRKAETSCRLSSRSC